MKFRYCPIISYLSIIFRISQQMSEKIDFEIGQFRNFDVPVPLIFTSDDFESHTGVCSWEEILFTIEDTIRFLPSLSVIDFTAVWTWWKMQIGPILKSHKTARDGRYRQYSVCLWEKVLSSIEYTIHFFHDFLLLIISHVGIQGKCILGHFWSPKMEKRKR